MKRINLGDELAVRVDAVRGDVSRDRWVRRAVEQALGANSGDRAVSGSQGRSSGVRPVQAGSTPAEPASSPERETSRRSTGPAPAASSREQNNWDRQQKLNAAKYGKKRA